LRTCGDCIVCCVYFPIDDEKLTKKAMCHCPHLILKGPIPKGRENGDREDNQVLYTGASCDGGCGIHDQDRASICSEYRCLWLEGYGDEEDRPDRSLMIFDRGPGTKNSIVARPASNGREEEPAGRALIEKMSRLLDVPVIVIGFYHRVPQEIVGRAVADGNHS
jgi:hypothetical protein